MELSCNSPPENRLPDWLYQALIQRKNGERHAYSGQSAADNPHYCQWQDLTLRNVDLEPILNLQAVPLTDCKFTKIDLSRQTPFKTVYERLSEGETGRVEFRLGSFLTFARLSGFIAGKVRNVKPYELLFFVVLPARWPQALLKPAISGLKWLV